MTPHDGIILDNDGVLIPPPGHAMLETAVTETLERFDIPPSQETKEPLLAGDHEQLAQMATTNGVAPGVLWRERERICHQQQATDIQAEKRQPYDDIDAIRRLAADCPIGVVSNNQHQTVDLILETFGLHDIVDTFYGIPATMDGLKRRKPNSYYLEKAIEDIDADNPLYVGDSESDIIAAQNAGIDVYFIRRDHRQQYHLNHEPTREIATLDEILAYR